MNMIKHIDPRNPMAQRGPPNIVVDYNQIRKT